MSEVEIPEVKWNEQGLAPAICQDAGTGQVLTLAWVNEESLRLTLEKGTVHFWSRSRRELWHKGETSGNYLHLVSARLDCDSDALVFIVQPDGPACHTNRMSCFFNEVPVPDREGGEAALDFDQNLLESVYRLILERKEAGDTDSSYVARLFARGEERVLEKIDEEAAEVVMAMKEEGPDAITNEVADLWFHTLVGMAAHDVPPGRVFAELARRFRRGGRPESER